MTALFKVAIAGLGTVGAGTVDLIQRQESWLTRRAGRPIAVTAVSARDRSRNRPVDVSGYAWFDDAATMAREADADLVVELIGGSDGVARSVAEAAFGAGRHVVTANKALIALHGADLAEGAEEAGVALAFEAAVAGGIPVLKAMREGLSGNRIQRVLGILNGTCNYILTTMRETGRPFDQVLDEAQQLGYAEADPEFDVDGIDAAHKLAILTSLAFETRVDFDSVYVEGIRHVSPYDIAYASELGYKIKLLGIAEISDEGIQQRVHPAMVPFDAPIAAVEGVYNGVEIDADFVGTTMLEGKGAGAEPTASAVVADIVDIAAGRRSPAFGVPVADLAPARVIPMQRHRGCYYVRLTVLDRPGVFADLAAALRDEDVSIETVVQRARSNGGDAVPVVLTTHEIQEDALQRALEKIGALPAVTEPPRVIRIEQF